MVSNQLDEFRRWSASRRFFLMIAFVLSSGSAQVEGAIALASSHPTPSSAHSKTADDTSTLPRAQSAAETAIARFLLTEPPSSSVPKAAKAIAIDRPPTLTTTRFPTDTLPPSRVQRLDNASSTVERGLASPPADPFTVAGEASALVGSEAIADLSVIASISAPPTHAEQSSAPHSISQANTSAEIPWRFVLEPYVYLPLETSGDVTIRNVEVPYDFSLGDVLESLTFALYGRFEAWKGPWAFVFDGYYFDTLESESSNIPAAALPPGLLPPEITQVPIDGTAETAFLKLDFAGAYRFGDRNLPNALSTAETDFDLGPFVFDAIAGLRLYSFSNDIELSTPLGFERDFSRSDTFIEPMIGGRARWNFADNVAAIAAANVSGFGIGTDISAEGYAGVDWLFSGNTSLTATYRLTYIDYSEGSSGFNLFQHGPALGVKFRF